ncbi:creatininase family protein [Microbacteriaceae bacterium VKM Ac-2854]|nr:creatininase family protein [Microbacteriaceae bacterium VKM Ac-2854]
MQAEYLTPAQLDAAIAAAPVAYLPLGSLEFHGPHLPIGLDTLNAHGVCVGAAQAGGGIVLPPVYQGLGGGHSDYPWTIMMADPSGIRSHLEQTFAKLEAFGVRLAVLFTGHFADEQLAMIDEIAASWNAAAHPLAVLATGVNRSDAPIAPDHAGVFESTLLSAFEPDLVHLELLPDAATSPDPGGDPMGEQRHDRAHPLWGVFGPDPRGADLARAPQLRDAVVSWLGSEVARRLG